MFLKRIRLISILLATFVVVLGGCGGSGKTQNPPGGSPSTSNNPNPLTALSISQGSVQLMKNGVGNWANMQVGSTLQAGDIIRTGDSSGATITFFDGSTIELKAGTQIEVSSLIGGSTGSTTILLKQQIGETISTVNKIMDPASRYEIETPAAVAAVRGSMMGVKVDSLGRTVVTNLEGHITVTAQGTEVSIPVGMQVAVNKGEAPGQPQIAPTTTPPVTTPPPTTTIPPTTIPPTTTPPPTTLGGSNATISSTTGWQQTTLSLVAGQDFFITYISGSWTVDYRNYPATGPGGCSPEIDRLINPVSKITQSAPFGALLGRVASGAIIIIGANSGPFKADSTGILYLRINDSDSAMLDNQGSLVMNISSTPFQAITVDVTSDRTEVFEGDTINYSYKVINHTASPMTNVTVTDGWSGAAVYQSGDTDSNKTLDVGEIWIFTSSRTTSHGDIGILTNTATAMASDNILRLVTSSGSIGVSVKQITIAFTDPGPNTIITGPQITLVGLVNDPSISQVTVTQNGTGIGTFSLIGGRFTAPVTLVKGTNTLQATITKIGAGSISARMVIDFVGTGG